MNDLPKRLLDHAALHRGLPDAEQHLWANDLELAATLVARYLWLREVDPLVAQAMFWNHTSRRQRDEAIDAAIAAERNA